jgi:hypothetical protein
MTTFTELYAIYDTNYDKYTTYNRSTWLTPGAAKTCALRLANISLSYKNRIRSYKDQSRYVVHKVRLSFIEDA